MPGPESLTRGYQGNSATSLLSRNSSLTSTITRARKNVVADALSQAPIISPISLSVNCTEIHNTQTHCQELCSLRNSSSLQLQKCTLTAGEPSIWCDVSTGLLVLFLLSTGFCSAFSPHHTLLHHLPVCALFVTPGVRGSQSLISDWFAWPHTRQDISNWTKEHISCQHTKTNLHVHSPVHHIPVPDTSFTHVHVDIVGPLPRPHGSSYNLTVTDHSARGPEAFPLPSISSADCSHAFTLGWVAYFGMPLDITSNRGCQFTSTVWNHFVSSLGVKLHRTLHTTLKQMGIIEKLHQSLKASLRARLSGPNWLDDLPWIMLSLRTTPKPDLHHFLATMIFKHQPLLLGTSGSPPSPDKVTFTHLPCHRCFPGGHQTYKYNPTLQ